MTPLGQLADHDNVGEPMTVPYQDIGFMIPLAWHGEGGEMHNDVFLLVGNQVYVPENSERWAAELAPAKDEIRRQVISKFKTQFKALVKQCLLEMGELPSSASLPGRDDVDIIPDGSTSEAAPAG